MPFIFSGVFGFSMLLLSDLASLSGKRLCARFLFAFGGLIIITSIAGLGLSFERIVLPFVINIAGIVFSSVFIVLGIYSIFIEIPLKSWKSRYGKQPVLVTTGTYALVRHPGVLWFSIAMAGFFFVFPSIPMLVAIPIWIISDICYVYYQERIVLKTIFGSEYSEYTTTVPFILPRIDSVRNCIRSFLIF
jgi:protein-S-isoprenylcysteine O-methyltransferase Ste14